MVTDIMRTTENYWRKTIELARNLSCYLTVLLHSLIHAHTSRHHNNNYMYKYTRNEKDHIIKFADYLRSKHAF